MALTPTSSTESIGPRSMGLIGRPSKLKRSLQTGAGLPSSGSPRPSITRPNNSGPKFTCATALMTRTTAPGPMPEVWVKGIRNKVLSLNPTTSASTRVPSEPITSHTAPNDATTPRVSSVKPTERTSVPLRSGAGLCTRCKSLPITSLKSSLVIGVLAGVKWRLLV